MPNNRSCGECTACCKTHGVQAIGKPSGVWCEHYVVGEGCMIYAYRPEECQTFQCLWLLELSDEENRPDIVGVVCDTREVERFGPAVLLYEAVEGAIASAFALRETKFWLERMMPVFQLPLTGRNRLYLPPDYTGNILPAGYVLDGKGTDVIQTRARTT